jgi:hypothetical protein
VLFLDKRCHVSGLPHVCLHQAQLPAAAAVQTFASWSPATLSLELHPLCWCTGLAPLATSGATTWGLCRRLATACLRQRSLALAAAKRRHCSTAKTPGGTLSGGVMLTQAVAFLHAKCLLSPVKGLLV